VSRTSTYFIRACILFGLVGMSLGIAMGASHDFTLAPVHAHINLLGWVSMVLFGLAYRVMPEMEVGPWPRIQLALAISGLALMAPGIAMIVYGMPMGEPVTILGSFLTLGSMLTFAAIVFRATASSPQVRPAI
jgi:hypothetical protein